MSHEQRRRHAINDFIAYQRRTDRIARWAIGLQLFSAACWIAVLFLEFWP